MGVTVFIDARISTTILASESWDTLKCQNVAIFPIIKPTTLLAIYDSRIGFVGLQ